MYSMAHNYDGNNSNQRSQQRQLERSPSEEYALPPDEGSLQVIKLNHKKSPKNVGDYRVYKYPDCPKRKSQSNFILPRSGGSPDSINLNIESPSPYRLSHQKS